MAVIGAVVLTACTSAPGAPAPGASGSLSAAPVSSAPVSSAPRTSAPVAPRPVSSPPARSSPPAVVPPGAVARAFAHLTPAQRVGQLFMVGTPATAASAETMRMISDHHVGSVILSGRSYLGRSATARITARLQARATDAATGRVPLLIATDQEGGEVQVLRGPGFSDMPTAVVQGRYPVATLRADAARWGAQLRAAGVSVDLGPVLDTVPPAFLGSNPPIAGYDRQYGETPGAVAAHGTAFAVGLARAGVDATIKHFPGLGRVHANPDDSTGVTDELTTRHDAFLMPYLRAIRAGAPLVMMSTAVYRRIDRHNPAAFSPTIVTGILRGDLGFAGVVISDDLGQAAQVQAWTPAERATKFIAAGGDIVLTVVAADMPSMTAAVLARTRTDPAFAAQVDAAALRVLTAKHDRHLL